MNIAQNNMFALKVTDNSMDAAGIKKGDSVIIDKCGYTDVSSGDIVVLCQVSDKTAYIRRIEETEKGCMYLYSENIEKGRTPDLWDNKEVFGIVISVNHNPFSGIDNIHCVGCLEVIADNQKSKLLPCYELQESSVEHWREGTIKQNIRSFTEALGREPVDYKEVEAWVESLLSE